VGTGYIGSVGLLQVIKRVVLALRASNPGLVYVCDPVLGDDGKLYLPEEMVDVYRSEVMQLATVLTPNQFEAELLTGTRIRTEQDALHACVVLLKSGPKTVVSHPKR
jgi:pyridoxine kinase